jgi:hypothetical protein
MTRRPSYKNRRAWLAYLNSRRPRGDTLKAKLAKASQDTERRPKPDLAQVAWLDLPWRDSYLDAAIAAARRGGRS